MKILPVTYVRQHFVEVLEIMEKEPVIITVFGRAKAALLSYQLFEDWQDKLAIYEGREQPRRPLEECRAELERSNDE